MKIEDLKFGDKIKYKSFSHNCECEVSFIQFKDGNCKTCLIKWDVTLDKGTIIYTDQIISKLEPISVQYKEIPIEKHQSIKFNFIPMSYSINNGRFSGTIMEMEGYISSPTNSAQRLTIPLVPNGLIPTNGKTYSIEIKEL